MKFYCPECFTTWTDLEDIQAHLKAHGMAEAANQVKSTHEIRRFKRWEGHEEKHCNCRAIGVRFECEIYKKSL